MRIRKWKLRSKLLITYIGLSLLLIVSGGGFTLGMVQRTLEKNMESELGNSTSSILSMVKTAAAASIKNYLRAVAEKNLETISRIHDDKETGKIDAAEMMTAIRAALASQVVGTSGYIYCIDSKGTVTFHPHSELEGKTFLHFGFVQEQIRKKQGYLEYEWKNPNEPRARPKALFMTYFEPLDWIVSVASYREEFTELIDIDDFRRSVLAFRFGETGYSYVIDDQGNAIIHPELEGSNAFTDFGAETDFISAMIARKKGVIRHSWHNPGETAARDKLVVFDYIPEYRWIVASSAYYDEVLKPYALLRDLIILSTVCVIAILTFSTLAISDHLLKPIGGLIEKFKAGAAGDPAVRMETGGTFEFNVLAECFNRFMAHHESARNALAASEQKYRLLAESIHDVIWLVAIESECILFASPSVQNVHGWSAEEAAGLSLQDFIPDRHLQAVRDRIARGLAGLQSTASRNSVKVELELYRKDRSCFWAEITASFLFDERNRPVSILGVTRDISDRKRAEMEKQDLQEKLDRSRKMEALGLLAGGVAHDLNNVLSGIVSYPDLLLLDLPEESPLRGSIETIKDSGQKAATIVQDLLTLARRNVINFEVLNLNALAEEYLRSPELDLLKSFHRGVRIESDLAADLHNIRGSAVHLKKTIMNLVSNAAEAQPGGGRVVVRTRNRYLDRPVKGYETISEGEFVLLSVTDQGHGIAPEDRMRIFEPFYTKKVMGRSGTGLGMAVVWGTVQDHKGYIDVISEVNRGTRFDLYFPITRENAGGPEPAVDLDQYSGRGESVLVVDDVEAQRRIAGDLLAKLNYVVHAAASGEEAAAFLRSRKVDLVILDMIMEPGMDGLDTYRSIRAIDPAVKVIIASGFAETDRVAAAQRLGAGAYVKKPYTVEQIGLAVRDALSGPGPANAEASGRKSLAAQR